jgi:hypothetical protein
MQIEYLTIKGNLEYHLISHLKAIQYLTPKSKFSIFHLKEIKYLTLKGNSVSHT